MWWPFSLWSDPEPKLKTWPTRTVKYCFREMKKGIRMPFPQEYRDLVRECAAEWTKHTVINLVEEDFFNKPEPQIVISLRDLDKKVMGFGFFPGTKALCGDIDIRDMDWFSKATRAYFKTIILHEFAHALGLKHSTYYRSILYAFPQAEEIHRFDITNMDEAYEDHPDE